MAICGYHPKMGSGIKEFAYGLTLSLSSKSDRLGLSMHEQMSEEAAELGTLIKLLNARYRAGTLKRRDFEAWTGLVNFVMFLMQPGESAEFARDDFEFAVHERVEQFDAAMVRFENVFESNLALPLRERLDLALSAAIENP